MEVAVIALGVVVIAQSIERYFYSKDMSQKLQDCIKAVMSRNIGEYIAATKPVDKTETVTVSTDEVPITDLSEDEFFKYIGKVNS